MIGRRTNYRRPCLQKMGQQSGMEIRISLESEVLLVISIYFVTLLLCTDGHISFISELLGNLANACSIVFLR